MKSKQLKVDANKRLYSLDVLRGFDMFWIIGGAIFMHTISKVLDWNWIQVLSKQMHHVSWDGFHSFDLVFPLFMFISGVAIPYAITSKREKGVSKSKLTGIVFRRMVLLVLFGIIYNNTLRDGFSGMRAAGVLAQIGISYFFASLIVLNVSSIKGRIFWLIGILSGIAILQLFVPVPGFGAGVITPEGSINAWIDQHFLPGILAYGSYDPEGVLCVFSAISVTLIGTLTGNILRSQNYSPNKKTGILAVAGVGLITIALALSPVYPIIKNIWTVPFDLLASGISMILLAIFYYILDVKAWRKGSFFFRVIGLNSITIYLSTKIIDFSHTSEYLLGWIVKSAGQFGPSLIVAGVIAAEWFFLYFLYKKKIFLKV